MSQANTQRGERPGIKIMVIRLYKWSNLSPEDRDTIEDLWIKEGVEPTASRFWDRYKETKFKEIYDKETKRLKKVGEIC